MKKILGVVGSPRTGGNTDVLVSALLAGAQAGGAAVEKVMLGELKIDECTGCHACWARKPCVHNDDMAGLFEKIVASDAIVFGTPVYWYAPSALMKGFIDRFVYFNCPENRPGVRGKQAAIVVPFEETDFDTSAPVVAFFERSLAHLEMDLTARLVVPGVTRRGEVAELSERMEEARGIGRRLARQAEAAP
jgi:multimeric flavodoxin WrbA